MAPKSEAKKAEGKPGAGTELDGLLSRLKDADKARRENPMRGRQADEAMMAVCQYLKDHPDLAKADHDRAIKTIKALNLRPYWNYCREHLLDIGLEF